MHGERDGRREQDGALTRAELTDGRFRLVVNALGAEMTSFASLESGHEYLWQGDEAYWDGQATNLFPVCGRFDGGRYSLDGEDYEIMIHGFAKLQHWQLAQADARTLSCSLEDSEETRALWPRRFQYRIDYALVATDAGSGFATRLEIQNTLTNRDERPLYVTLGGHPGFNIPIEAGLRFDQHRLVFPRAEAVEQAVLSKVKLYSGSDAPFALEAGGRLGLDHGLFDDDALFLRGTGGHARIEAEGSGRSIAMDYEDFDWLGLWHTPETDAPFICLEPWTGLCGRDSVHEALETMPGMTKLEPGETRSWRWAIEIREA